MAVVAAWLALGWVVGGTAATWAPRLYARLIGAVEACDDSSHGTLAFIRSSLGLTTRSACPACGASLREPWPYAEALTALVFAALAWRFGLGAPLLLYSALAAALCLVSLIDIRHRIIPDAINLSVLAVALAVSPFTIGIGRSIAGAAVAGGIFLLLYIIARVLYRRSGVLGLGDVKLAFAIGAVTGSPAAVAAVSYAVIAGGVLAVALIVAGRSRKYAMPYGPSLAIGAIVTLLSDPTVWR